MLRVHIRGDKKGKNDEYETVLTKIDGWLFEVAVYTDIVSVLKPRQVLIWIWNIGALFSLHID